MYTVTFHKKEPDTLISYKCNSIVSVYCDGINFRRKRCNLATVAPSINRGHSSYPIEAPDVLVLYYLKCPIGIQCATFQSEYIAQFASVLRQSNSHLLFWVTWGQKWLFSFPLWRDFETLPFNSISSVR